MLEKYQFLNESSNILITGCTGLIGGEFLQKLLDCQKGKIWTLVRATSADLAKQRIRDRLLRSNNGNGSVKLVKPELKVVLGDITKPNWGISNGQLEEIISQVDCIIHFASDTSFLNSESVIDCNTSSVQMLVDMIKDLNNPPRVVYISTAANIGKVKNVVIEENMSRASEGDHHNLYTQSKAICETMLHEAGVDVLILRPSIVLSAGIEDSSFASSILWIIPLLYKFAALPLDKNSRLDIVPVEFVVESIISLLRKEYLKHSVYHISAGESDCITLQDAFHYCNQFYNRPSFQFIDPERWDSSSHSSYINTRGKRTLYNRVKYYFPFLNMDVVYNNGRLKEELGELEIPALKDYIKHLLSQVTEEVAIRESVKP